MEPDARAVENPISAIFDLSEDVTKQAPNIRSLVKYATAFIIVWLIINFLLGLVLLVSGNFFLMLIMLTLFIIGLTSLILLNRVSRFFKYYVARHRAITAVREMDPMVYAPKGNNATERLVTYLRQYVPAMSGSNVEVAMPGIVQGQDGVQYSFDAYLKEPSGGMWKSFGFGKHGFAVYIKRFDGPPTKDQLVALKNAAEKVSLRNKIPPVRVIALWERGEEDRLSDDAYHFATNNWVGAKHKFRNMKCALEIVSESQGTYDFIPFMTQ